MRKPLVIGTLMLTAQILGIASVLAGPWEDGMAAYNRADYAPAIRLFRPLAQAGNAKAQHLIGVMYHRGQGVTRNTVRAMAWLSVAAKHGDREAQATMSEVSKTMTPDEIAEARDMARACEASDYRNCEY